MIVGYGDGPNRDPDVSAQEALVWTSTSLIGLGDFGTVYHTSRANGVSESGHIVVGTAADPDGNDYGFSWTESTGIVRLGRCFSPTAVTASGVIIGDYGSPYIVKSSIGTGDLKAQLIGCGLDLTGWWPAEIHDITPDGRSLVGSVCHRNFVCQAMLVKLP